MNVIQYGAVVPAGYDMERFRERVRLNGHLLDDRAGLAFKAYLMREHLRDGSPVNYYGSLYLWNDAAELARFLLGGAGFERIIMSLGRLSVDQWVGVASFRGLLGERVTKAVRDISALPSTLDAREDGLGLAEYVSRECEALAEIGRRADVHTAALAVDPHQWRLLKFVAGGDSIPAFSQTSEFYEVLHVSQPERDRLKDGKVW
jgi:hypothetical protein